MRLFKLKKVTPELVFMISAMVVNAGNYLYNLLLGRFLGPSEFSDAAVLVTLLLVLSFLAMTFQLTVTKFSATLPSTSLGVFLKYIKYLSFILGLALCVLIIVFRYKLQQVFNTESSTIFLLFGLGVPWYFLMSTNRGYLQGKRKFILLSCTYQSEMLTRLVISFVLIFVFTGGNSVLYVAVGILSSFFVALFPYKLNVNGGDSVVSSNLNTKPIVSFMIVTAFYELTQIVINNSDILLAKHYFDSYTAGLYASLALIGRMVYFLAWMLVMVLLPNVLKKKKEGQDTLPVFIKYLLYIIFLSGIIVLSTFLFPETIVMLMFGEAYISIADYLCWYALIAALFAIANVFVYYFLSLDKYIPIVLSGFFGIFQILGILLYHHSIWALLKVQLLVMVFFLLSQVLWFFYHTKKDLQLR